MQTRVLAHPFACIHIACTHTQGHAHRHTCAHAQAHTHANTGTHRGTRVHTCSGMRTRKHGHTRIHRHTLRHAHTCKHRHTQAHVCTHANTGTHAHTGTRVRSGVHTHAQGHTQAHTLRLFTDTGTCRSPSPPAQPAVGSETWRERLAGLQPVLSRGANTGQRWDSHARPGSLSTWTRPHAAEDGLGGLGSQLGCLVPQGGGPALG